MSNAEDKNLCKTSVSCSFVMYIHAIEHSQRYRGTPESNAWIVHGCNFHVQAKNVLTKWLVFQYSVMYIILDYLEI